MMKTTIHIILLAVAVFAGCSRNEGPGSDRTLSPAVFPVDSIAVTSNNQLVETYSFAYDDKGRLVSLVRMDMISGKELMKLSYVYDGGSSVTVSGRMDGRTGTSTLKVSHSPDRVSWENDGVNAWLYSTSVGDGGLAECTETLVSFGSNAGHYKSSTTIRESYTSEGGDIVSVGTGTSIESKALKAVFGEGKNGFKPVSLTSGSTLVTSYKYSAETDRQNFNSFLFDCSFPVWYAEGLPGCEHLISDISMSAGSVTVPQTQHLDYTTDPDGNIQTAVRSWTSDGEVYLRLKYEFHYNK